MRNGGKIKKAMISRPMAGKTGEGGAEAGDRAHAGLREMGHGPVNAPSHDGWHGDAAMGKRGAVQAPPCLPAKSPEALYEV